MKEAVRGLFTSCVLQSSNKRGNVAIVTQEAQAQFEAVIVPRGYILLRPSILPDGAVTESGRATVGSGESFR